MGYVCRSCDYYDGAGTSGAACPECGDAMRFTMMGPATATATIDAPAPREDWKDPYKYGYDVIEAPWSFRYAQIGVGIAAYWVVSRVIGIAILLPLAFSLAKVDRAQATLTIMAVSLAIYCAAAVIGGAVAGFWARNWIAQGLGVTIGVSFLPLVVTMVINPGSLSNVLVGAALTFPFTVLGALLGHLLVRPTRVPHS